MTSNLIIVFIEVFIRKIAKIVFSLYMHCKKILINKLLIIFFLQNYPQFVNMNAGKKIYSPIPSKKYMGFQLITPEKQRKSYQQEDITDMIEMRVNSKNPHIKDENFKSQTFDSFGEIEKDWGRFEEEFAYSE